MLWTRARDTVVAAMFHFPSGALYRAIRKRTRERAAVKALRRRTVPYVPNIFIRKKQIVLSCTTKRLLLYVSARSVNRASVPAELTLVCGDFGDFSVLDLKNRTVWLLPSRAFYR